MPSYYKYSGSFTPQGLIGGMLAGAIVSIPASFLYNYGIVTTSFDKARFLCTTAFGLLIGAACGLALCWGKVRNKTVAGLVGAGGGLFGLYVSWIGWLMHLSYPGEWIFNVFGPARHPLRIWNAMLQVNAVGTWSSGSDPEATKGFVLWLIWIAEAGFVVAVAASIAIALVARRPFCEHCGQWCADRHNLGFGASLPAPKFQALLESGNVSELEKLGAASAQGSCFEVHLHSCGVCNNLNTLSLVQRFSNQRKTIVDKLLVTPAQASTLRNLAVAQRAARAGTRTAALAK
jgi:hypothetical protein